MAKKINTDNPAVTGQAGETVTGTPETDVQNVRPETKPEAQKTAEPSAPPVPDEHVMQILKVYPNYETLYVDRYGCTYAPDTPPMLRKEAVLYKNPFYETSKTKD